MENKKMLKNLLTVMLFVILICYSLIVFNYMENQSQEINLQNCYPDLLQVVDVSDGIVLFKNSNGFMYALETDMKDIFVGEFYNALLYNNNTKYVMDDIILDIHYERPDLFTY